MKCPKFLRDIFTEKDGVTYDAKRLAGMMGMLTFIALSAVAVVWHHQAVDFVALGTGIGVIVGAIGGSIMMGKGGESPPKE